MKTLTRTVTTILRRPPARTARHRLGRLEIPVRTHPWFEQRAQRVAELGSRS
ncbi:MAG TPA: hypothetical protein VNR36_10935 [Pseudolysinimonas sp.]|nr:hypothetical protein [Pseudolysinimonas sp.]